MPYSHADTAASSPYSTPTYHDVSIPVIVITQKTTSVTHLSYYTISLTGIAQMTTSVMATVDHGVVAKIKVSALLISPTLILTL